MVKMKKKITIAKAEDWLTVDRVNEVYEKQMNIFSEELGIKDVNEYYFEQNLDTKGFKAKLTAKEKLDTRTTLLFDIKMFSDGPIKEVDGNLRGKVRVSVNAVLQINGPAEGNLPKSLKTLFTFMWWYFSYNRQFAHWQEYGISRLNQYISAVREFLGLEPAIGKIKRMSYKPIL